MNAPFSSQAEAAATAWGVPALAAGFSVAGEAPVTAAVGCELATIFRVASITKPLTATLALELLDLEATTGVWPDDVRIRHLLSHTSGYDCECGDLARFGAGDDALGGVVAELPGVRRLVGVEQAWSYANTGYWLAAHLAADAGRLHLRGGARGPRPGAGRARVDVVRRARARGHRRRGVPQAPIRAPAARPAGWSRTCPTCSASATGTSHSPGSARLRVPAGQADVRRLRPRARRRAGGRRRGLGPRRLVRRLPVVAPRHSRAQGGVRRR